MSDIDFDRVEDFFGYARERESIRMKRLAGLPKPWTRDPILQQYRFCNVYREDDTVTQWVRRNIREPYQDHDLLWLMLAIARTINWPDTLQWCFDKGAMPVTEHWNPEWLTTALNQWQDQGNQVYTGAYMIRAESDPNKPWYSWRKNRYVAEIVIGNLWKAREAYSSYFNGCRIMEGAWEALQINLATEKNNTGWGPFMAYEVVTDMRYTRYLYDATDRMTWANPGPGAARGLCRLMGLDKNAMSPSSKRDRPKMMEAMRELLEWSRNPDLIPEEWVAWEMREVEHTLCEFDKYERVRLGEGKPRSLYNGKA